MKAFITGIAGFAGRHLAEHLLLQQAIVSGSVRPGQLPETTDLAGRGVVLSEVDITVAGGMSEALRAAEPDAVFHLAAQASVSRSWQDPEETLRINVLGQLHVLEALVALGTSPTVVVVSSNEVYGAPAGPEDLPIREDAPLRPSSPYAVSKAAQDLMAYQYFLSGRLPVVRVRPFNHIGPGQSADYVAASFARQIALAEAGRQEPVLKVGNLEAVRDFTDVRDMVAAYEMASTLGRPGEAYNIGSGRPVSVEELLDILLSLSSVSIRVERDRARYRPVDVPCIYADTGKFTAATGWKPVRSLEETLRDVLEYWRAEVSAGR